MNAPLAPWWSDLRADLWICGRQSAAERDAEMYAAPAYVAAQATHRRQLAARAAETGRRIVEQGAVVRRTRAHYAFWEELPSSQPEEL